MKSPRSHALTCLCAALVGFVGACGGSQTADDAPVIERTAAEIRTARALARADQSLEAIDVVETDVRVNPATCDCPPWEALLYGRWTRVALERTPVPGPEGDEVEPPMPADGTVFTLTLERTNRAVPSDTGWRYPVLREVEPEAPARLRP